MLARTWHLFSTIGDPNRTMWTTLDRARRRISALVEGATEAVPAQGQPGLEDVVIILGAVELDQLREALELELGDAIERPDTPARFERALSLLLFHRGVPGKPRVLRRPAGVSTPESWEIHLDGIQPSAGAAVREASKTGVFTW
jgi:hypothetical protein